VLFNLKKKFFGQSSKEVKIVPTTESSADDLALVPLLKTYVSGFEDDIKEFTAPASYNLNEAYEDTKATATSLASVVFNLFTAACYAVTTALQFVYSGLSGVYEKLKVL
jgi:hypothetical protein